jgi:ElaB/YqjD/DUF883 family membrane-anchored ribosome-binding protein
MTTASDRLGKQATKVKKDLEQMSGTAKDIAEDQLEYVGEMASEYYEQGLEKVHGVACACEQFIRERPVRSVLMAAGIGWLLGQVWKRR